MSARTIVLAVGTAFTTFLLAGAATMMLLGGGEAPGIGMIGVFVGFLTGVLAGLVVGVYVDRLSGITSHGVVAYAVFGITFLAIAGMRYVNVPGADDLFTFPLQLALSIATALLVALLDARGVQGKRPSTA